MPKRLLTGLFFVFAAVMTALQPRPSCAQERVDVLLVLAADVSRSVDATKFKLQREGYAAAIASQQTFRAISAGAHKKIAIQFVEWAGASEQAIVIDWTLIASHADLEAFAAKVLAAPRPFAGRTAIGPAIDYAMTQLDRGPFKAERRVIDVSGDGTHNHGKSVTTSRDEAIEKGVIINGIAILSAVPQSFNPEHTHPPGGLLKYYEDNVIGGPGAFALAAESFEAFGQSILSKLMREISDERPAGVEPKG